MAVQGGYGIAVQIDVSGTLASLAKVIDMDVPEYSKYIAEATTHDSTGGYYEAVATGKRRLNPFTVTLAWDSADTSHAAVLAAFDGDTAVTFTVADPDGNETISTELHVETVKRIWVQEDVIKAEVTLHPTGQPSIA